MGLRAVGKSAHRRRCFVQPVVAPNGYAAADGEPTQTLPQVSVWWRIPWSKKSKQAAGRQNRAERPVNCSTANCLRRAQSLYLYLHRLGGGALQLRLQSLRPVDPIPFPEPQPTPPNPGDK